MQLPPSVKFSPTNLAVYLVIASSVVGAVYMKLSGLDVPNARQVQIDQSVLTNRDRVGFSVPKWQEHGTDERDRPIISRLYRFKQFMDEYGLIGLRRDQILQLLGPPNQYKTHQLITKMGRNFFCDIDTYCLESEQSATGVIECHLLYVHGIVTKYFIGNGAGFSDNVADWLSKDQ